MSNIPAPLLVFAAFVVCVGGYIALSWANKTTGVLDEATLILVGGLAGIVAPQVIKR